MHKYTDGKVFKQRSMPGKGASTGHFHTGEAPDGGRQVRCIVGLGRMLRAYLGDFQKRGLFFTFMTSAGYPCVRSQCVCALTCTFDQTSIIGPSSSLDFDSALSSCQPTTLLLCCSHFVSRWQLHADASHNTAECTNHQSTGCILTVGPFYASFFCVLW